MRNIKFRGKRVDNGDWVESMTISKGVIKRKRDFFYMEVPQDNWTQVIPETIGQFTGLKDKNGTEIYEGDIVIPVLDDMRQNTCEVRIGQAYESAHCAHLYSAKLMSVYYFRTPEFFQVIGNIHDNPELLNAAK